LSVINYIRLVILAAIWGASFIFLRVLAPAIGALWTSSLRVLIASVILLIAFFFIKQPLQLKNNISRYVMIGLINTAIPFSLYAFAAKALPASYSAILNSTSPFFGSLFSALWLADKLNGKKILGIVFGATGVIFVMGIKPHSEIQNYVLNIFACLLASLCYGLGGVYAKKYGSLLPAKSVAALSQLASGILILPLAIKYEPLPNFSPLLIGNMLGLAILCSAIAYLMYYQIIAEAGPAKALTVTFLMPLFGVFWAHIFLDEPIGWNLLLGGVFILLGVGFVVGKKNASSN
jgi:drug/metabolite transporter (DMT)-like permease